LKSLKIIKKSISYFFCTRKKRKASHQHLPYSRRPLTLSFQGSLRSRRAVNGTILCGKTSRFRFCGSCHDRAWILHKYTTAHIKPDNPSPFLKKKIPKEFQEPQELGFQEIQEFQKLQRTSKELQGISKNFKNLDSQEFSKNSKEFQTSVPAWDYSALVPEGARPLRATQRFVVGSTSSADATPGVSELQRPNKNLTIPADPFRYRAMPETRPAGTLVER